MGLLYLKIAACRPVILLARGGCGPLPLLQQFDPLFDVVVPVLLSILLGSSTAVAALSFGQVPTLATLRVFSVELLVASVEDVHLRVEELWVLLHVQVPVQFAQLRPELRCSLLALTVEDKYGSFLHQVPYVVEILEERFLEQCGVVDILGILDVANLELVVPSAVDDDVGMALLAHQKG